MNDKRRLPRKRPDVPLQVTDAMTGELVGRLGNLSMEGMMVIANGPVVEDGLYQFIFHLPDVHGQLHRFEVGVHESWTEAAGTRDQIWAGFRFIDINADNVTMLSDWLMHAEDFRG